MPIGNLTSQLLSNVYLNEFDQYMKRVLKCKHYGRYVDDAYVVSCDKDWLLSIIDPIDEYLRSRLHLEIHRGKTHLHDVSHGVEFLGGFILPGRTYMSHAAVRRLRQNVDDLKGSSPAKLYRSINSMLGVMSHFNNHRLCQELFCVEPFLRHGHFSDDMTHYYLDRQKR